MTEEWRPVVGFEGWYELSAQFVSDISFGMMNVFNPEETLRVPSKGVIYR